jgi:hypothetical protein
MKKALFALLIALLGTLAAQAADAKVYTAHHINPHAPQIDGRGDDPCWQKAEWSGGFTQSEPDCGAAPGEPTEFKVMYDDKHLYVLVRCHDGQAGNIVRQVSRRDEIDGDYVAVLIDSYLDKRTALGFKVSAAGVKADVTLSGDANLQDDTWDPIWDAAAAVDDRGWTTEMAIPFSQLRFASGEHVTFGLQVRRLLHRRQEISSWQHIPKEAPGFVSCFGVLDGLQGIRAQHQVELVPYAVAQVALSPREAGNPFADGRSGALLGGLDGKIGLTSDLTLDFTVNPDFGQVEADPSVVNLTGYETFFQEKRPFFTEGKSILDFQIMGGDGDFSMDNLFYSRRIGRAPRYEPETGAGEHLDMPTATSILGAFKVTGKTRHGFSLGILDGLTARETAAVSANGLLRDETVEPLTNYFMLRAQQDLNEGKTILGAMVTAVHRDVNDPQLDFLHRQAYSGGFDLYHSWKDRRFYVAAKTVFSLVQGSVEAIDRTQRSSVHYFQRPDAGHLGYDPARTALGGWGGNLEFGRSAGSGVNWAGGLTWRSPGLELNDMGYLGRGDVAMAWGWAGYRIRKPTWILNQFNINFNAWQGYDFSGEPVFVGGNVNFWSQFRNYWSINLGVNRQGRNLSIGALRGGPALRFDPGWNVWGYLNSDPRKGLSGTLSGSIYRAENDTRESGALSLTLAYRAGSRLSLRVAPGYSFNRNLRQYVATCAANGESRYVLGEIEQNTYYMTLRLNYCITPDLSIQFYGQPFLSSGRYAGFSRVVSPRARSIGDQLRPFAPGEISLDAATGDYRVNEGGAGYSFADPDFSVLELRSNLVLRWEYRPGAAVYAVWSHGRSGDGDRGNIDLGDGFADLMRLPATNVFLVKFTYNFNL